MILLDLPFPKTCMECPLAIFSITSSCRLLDGGIEYPEFSAKRRDDCPIREIRKPDRSNDKLLEDAGFEL